MKIIATLFAIGLMAGCNAAFAAEAGDASGADPSNPFSGAMTFGPPGTRIIISGEDLSSPFPEAHPLEQGSYKSQYYNRYHGPFYDVNAPAPQKKNAQRLRRAGTPAMV